MKEELGYSQEKIERIQAKIKYDVPELFISGVKDEISLKNK